MSTESVEARVAVIVAGLNILAAAVTLYDYVGTDSFVGQYNGQPVLYYEPTAAAVIGGLSLLAIGFLLFFSAGGGSSVLRRKAALAAIVASSAFAAGLIASQASTAFKVIILGGREDSYVIQVAAARALLSGLNPYSLNYSHELLSKVAAAKLTFVYRSGPPFTVSNAIGVVNVLDYPAFSFLYYVPAVIMRLPGNVWDAIVLGVAVSLVYLRVKRPYRMLLLPIISAGAFYYLLDPVSYDPISGWLAPALLVVAFADNPVVSGVLLGLATSYREYAVAAALVYFPLAARRGVKRLGLGVLSMAVTIAAVNMPFLLLSGGRFIQDVLVPVRYRLDIEGLGLASTYFLTGRPLPHVLLVSMTAIALLLAPLLTYRLYDRLGGLTYAIPALAFLLYPRPLFSYWLWFPWIGAIDYMANDVSRRGLPLAGQGASLATAALAPLVSISVVVSSLMAADGAVVSPLTAAAAGTAIFASLLLVPKVIRPGVYTTLVPAAIISGLIGASVAVRLYAASPSLEINAPPPYLTRPVAVLSRQLYMDLQSLRYTPVVQLVVPYGPSLILRASTSLRPAFLTLSPAPSQLWTSMLIAVSATLVGLSARSYIESVLVSETIGAAVFVKSSPTVAIALTFLLLAAAIEPRADLLRSALKGAAASLSPLGLVGAIASARRPTISSAAAVTAAVALSLALLRGGYPFAVLTLAAKYIYVYLVLGIGSLVTFITLSALIVVPPLLTSAIRRLSPYSWASPLLSLAAIEVAGFWDPSYSVGYVAFTLLTALMVSGGHAWRHGAYSGPPS